MSLRDVLHQDGAMRQLRRALSSRRVPHAYLFHGPAGVGKELAAIGFAELMLCPNPTETPPERAADANGADEPPVRHGCGTCDDCRAVRAGSHPDVHIIHRRLNRDHRDAQVRKRKAIDISVDVLRQFVIEAVGLTPARGRVKVFIIREAERMSDAAQNALLKTLEEPPGATFLVLLADGVDSFLPTTLSRCQAVAFQRLPDEFVRRRLDELRPQVSAEVRSWCAAMADGSIGAACQAVDDAWFEVSGRVAAILAADRDIDDAGNVEALLTEAKGLGNLFGNRDPEISDTDALRSGLNAVFSLLANQFAQRLRRAVGWGPATSSSKSGDSESDDVFGLSESSCRPREIDIIRRIALAEHHLDQNANAQLVVESLLIDVARKLERPTPRR